MPSIVTSYNPTLSGSADTRAQDTITFPFDARPQAMSIYLKFQERGTILVPSEAHLLDIGPSPLSGAAIRIDKASGVSVYRIRYGNGITSAVQSQLTTGPAVGNIVELLGTLSPAGSVQLHQSINGGSVTSATASAAVILPPAWTATTLVRLNGVGSSTVGAVAFMNIVIVRNVHDMTAMRRYAATQRAA